MDVRLKGQAVIKRNMKRYSVLLLGMHENSLDSTEVEEAERRLDDALWVACVEINQCVGCTRQFFTKSFLGDDAAVLAPLSGGESASPRHRAGVASMAWRSTRRFSKTAP